MSRPGLRIQGGTVAAPSGPTRTDLEVQDGHVLEQDHGGHGGRGGHVGHGSAIVIDATDLIIAPGFIDLQVNGGHGIDLTSELEHHPDRLWRLAGHLPEQGVTAFLPTVISSPPAALEGALRALHQRPSGHLGAAPLGVHAEGPMLAPTKRGTHDADHLHAPADALIGTWSRSAGIAMATLAPDLPGAIEVIRKLITREVVVSIGHTEASYEQAIAALDAGARAGTHLFNAMSGWTARDPGAAGALLTDPRATVGVIVDEVHLHRATVIAAWRLLGPARLALVTDAVAASGTGVGRASLGGRSVTIADGAVRDGDGALAGSILTLDRALRTLVATVGADPFEALATVTSTPAALLGERDRGHLRPGARGDLVVLTPELEVVATFVGGRLAALPRPDLLAVPSECA